MPAPLPAPVRDRLRQIMKERVLPRFGSDPDSQQSAAARAMKIHPSSINRLVNQGVGGSVDMIERVEKLLNMPSGTILGYRSEISVPRFRDLPGFAEVIDEAERRAKENRIQVSRRDLEFAGDFRLSPAPARLTPDFLVQLALTLADNTQELPRSPKRRKK